MIPMKGPNVLVAIVGVMLIGLLGGGCAWFESEQVTKGRKLFMHYCVHCHGPDGYGNGYNALNMDPRPRDLTDSGEEFMTTLSDEEVFNVFSRDMMSFEEFEWEFEEEENYDEMLFVPSNMPTFKNTLSEEERWALVAFVRTLHGMEANVDLAALRQEREAKVQEAQVKFDEVQKILEAAEEAAEALEEEEADLEEEDADEEAMAEEEEESDEPGLSKEEEAFEMAETELEDAQAALQAFSKRPREQIARPELASTPEELEPLIEEGKTLYSDKYGCDACHAIAGFGGVVGPELDRAGFRLNATWIYQWIRSPQAMKRKTRMPNLGLTDEHARAVTAYLGTLRASPPSASGGTGIQQAAVE